MAEAWRSPQQQQRQQKPAASPLTAPSADQCTVPVRSIAKVGGGGGERTMARQGIGKEFFVFLRCLCGREHGPQMKRLVTITNECFERVSPTPRALLRQPPNLPDWMDGGGGGGDTQFAPNWDARIAAGICWCRAAWHSALQGCRNGGAARREWAGWDCRAELDGVGGRARRDRTTGFAARLPETLRVHQARSTPLRQPGRRADLAGLAGLAGWDRGDRELRKDWKLSRRARAFPQLETHHQSR
ncbi:hypothetical protein VFPFJ_10248 [Purpureocillium lilacinum]|uniref:Uncharacterized protein n=1 Tax=Purpureocillium lilacinum TaxID=33203 RepID=A0A179GKJ9_PURLI|nr:hypothetical protein VFPFJ_10248 [Purpureocillium lilacinum]OAQ77881.1 hypothetical protein VFPFJ_10248 [Purpureocillium lilacinum]